MRRQLAVTLLIGLAASGLVLGVAWLGAFREAGEALARTYAGAGWFPGPGAAQEAGFLELGLAMAAAFGAAWCMIDLSRAGQRAAVILGLLAVLLALSPTLALRGVAFAPFPPLGAALVAAGAGLAYLRTERGDRKRLLEAALGDRVSRHVFRQLMEDPGPVAYAGETREVSVVVCRIFGHEALRREMAPGDLVAMGNHLLAGAADFLVSRGAYLDEAGPDLVRGVFGLARPDPGHARSACRAALGLRERLRGLADEAESRWLRRLGWGVGIGSGLMTAGLCGAGGRARLSGAGGEADFAARLALANHRYGSDLLMSAAAWQQAGEAVEARPVELFYDAERDLMGEVYQLLAMAGDLDEAARDRRDAYWEGVALLRGGKADEARARFAAAAEEGKEDGPLRYQLERAKAGLEEPSGGSGAARARPLAMM